RNEAFRTSLGLTPRMLQARCPVRSRKERGRLRQHLPKTGKPAPARAATLTGAPPAGIRARRLQRVADEWPRTRAVSIPESHGAKAPLPDGAHAPPWRKEEMLSTKL